MGWSFWVKGLKIDVRCYMADWYLCAKFLSAIANGVASNLPRHLLCFHGIRLVLDLHLLLCISITKRSTRNIVTNGANLNKLLKVIQVLHMLVLHMVGYFMWRADGLAFLLLPSAMLCCNWTFENWTWSHPVM